MSPRAACRLEELGFEYVYDYELGIADWKAAGLQLEGAGLGYQTAADAMRGDMPTCAPTESIGAVRERVLAAGWEDCLVVECDGLVTGRLRRSAWDQDDDTIVADIMQVGPTTVRANEALDRLLERMDRRPTELIVVATPQGQLLGVVIREDAHRVLEGDPPEMIWVDCEGCPGQWMPARPGSKS